MDYICIYFKTGWFLIRFLLFLSVHRAASSSPHILHRKGLNTKNLIFPACCNIQDHVNPLPSPQRFWLNTDTWWRNGVTVATHGGGDGDGGGENTEMLLVCWGKGSPWRKKKRVRREHVKKTNMFNFPPSTSRFELNLNILSTVYSIILFTVNSS